MNTKNHPIPGPIALFGSGETAPSGQKIFDSLFQLTVREARVSILETPAGFELNSHQVAGNVSDFIQHRLQNYKPELEIIPARKKGTPFSPDNAEIVAPLLRSDLIFMGPGSPSYAVRQLKESLAWEYVLARHRMGAGLAFSSATTVAISSSALPVYEIYKVGQDLHWIPGLDFFGPYGATLIFIPHWNNQDGGEGLDTSRCYMGKPRFEELLTLLPPEQTVIGIDENTGLVIDFQAGCLNVVGQGDVTILKEGIQEKIPSGSSQVLSALGFLQLDDPLAGISQASWEAARNAEQHAAHDQRPTGEIITLAEERDLARADGDWDRADQLREEIERQGWVIQDTPDGFQLEKK